MSSTLMQPVLQTASHLAAAGQYEDALALMEGLEGADSSISLLLLRAKILVQQKKYQEAVAQWRKVLKQQPDNAEALAGMRRVEKLTQGPFGRLYGYSAGFKITMLLVVVAAGTLVSAALFGVPALGRSQGGADTYAGPVTTQELTESLQRLEGSIRTAMQIAAAKEAEAADRRLQRERELLERRFSQLESVVQQRATQAQMEGHLANLRQRIDATFEEQAGALERGARQEIEEKTDKVRKELQQQMEWIRRNQLIDRACDLYYRNSPTDRDLNMLERACKELRALGCDTASAEWAEKLLKWVQEERTSRQELKAGRQKPSSFTAQDRNQR